jgi:hypothetical protein
MRQIRRSLFGLDRRPSVRLRPDRDELMAHDVAQVCPDSTDNRAAAEIDRALDDNPGFKVAIGPGVAAFDAQSLRVIPVFRGNPLPIDSSSWLDLEAQGISDEVVRHAIRECRVDIWLLPSGAPFVTISHYHGRYIYSAEMLADFRAIHTKQLSGKAFDQWKCEPRDEDSGPGSSLDASR